MSFCRNTSQQLNVFDAIYQLTEREQKRLKNSWAEKFGHEVFPLINEERFSVLYSNNPATRPNNPVNVYVGLLMLRELFDQTDEEALDSLMFDVRYQYALHTTSLKEQPVSKNSLTNFRTAVYRYNEENGVDLIQQEVESHAEEFTKLLNIKDRTVRMDSMMISSSCKKLSRLEIIYSCVSRLIVEINKEDASLLSEKFKVYLKEEHRNDTIYRCKDKDLDSKMKLLTADAIELFSLCRGTSLEPSDDYQLLARMLGEQTLISEGICELKPSKEISPESLQNPTDPDATYRRKANKNYIGYTANFAESFDEQHRIITHYDLQPNTYSDQKFSDDYLEKQGKQDEELRVLVDGAYYSEEISKNAEKNNIKMIPTNLVGRNPSSEKTGYEQFDIDESNHIVNACPMHHAPTDSKFKKQVYRAHFSKKLCTNCPHRPHCPVSEQKKQFLFEVSETKLHCSMLRAEMGTAEYKEIASKRAGVEGIPSILRRKHDVDHLPVRGRVRSKVWFGFKIDAINTKRFIKSRIETTKSALASLVNNNLLEVLCFQRTFLLKQAA